MAVIADDAVALTGTLTLPAGPGPHPAVLLLHGSGPLDREGNTAKVRMNLAEPLATALAAAGIAVLRYDRRGTGGTPGDWRATGFTDNRNDAAAAVRALAAQPCVRADAIGVIGHSEGALHAMSLGALPDVTALVLLAGYARGGEEALRWQARSLARGLPAPLRLLLPALRALGNRQIARIKSTTTDVARVAGIAMNARWTREMFRHDTRKDLAAVRVPVLALTGDKDIQVDPGDLAEIRRLVPGEAEVHRIPHLTHLLRRDPGQHSMRSYRRLLREPVDPDLLTQITDWLSHQLLGTARQLGNAQRVSAS
ncbi:alpha/beta hydrolase family protein [Streptomyces iconiensis]